MSWHILEALNSKGYLPRILRYYINRIAVPVELGKQDKGFKLQFDGKLSILQGCCSVLFLFSGCIGSEIIHYFFLAILLGSYPAASIFPARIHSL